MSTEQILQAAISLIAAATPWIVVSVVASRAGVRQLSREQAVAVTRASRRLTILTVALAVPLVGFALRAGRPRRCWASRTSSRSRSSRFPGLAALHAIDRATHAARELSTPERVASLAPRTIRQFLSLPRN